MTYTRIRAAVAVLLAVLTVAAGLSVQALFAQAANGSGTWGGPTAAPRTVGVVATADVLIVGDSIVNGCSGQLTTAFKARGLTVAIIAQSGQRTRGLADLLIAQPKLPGRVVMAAGSNDIFSPTDMAPQLARVKAHAAAKGYRLQWADTFVARTTVSLITRTHDLVNSTRVNTYIHTALPGAVISPKAALLAAVQRGRPLSYHLKDGVHYWPSAGTGHGNGCAFYAGTMAAGVK